MKADALVAEQWAAASPRDQEAAARVVGDMLLAAGFPLEFEKVQAIPAGRVAVFADRRHELEWVLVPGGRLRGWGEREKRLLTAAVQAIEGWRLEDEAAHGPVPALADLTPYGAESFEFSSVFRPDAQLSPFLTTAVPLLGTTQNLPELAAERARLLGLSTEPTVFTVHRDELERILTPRGWRLPSPAESQWMTGAGKFVFPWGDELPGWMSGGDDEVFDAQLRLSYASAAIDWPRTNGFGLVDALVASHWVDEGERLFWAGGTGECYPWQACGEWAGFITAAFVPEPEKTDPWKSHALRPVIQLTGR